MCPTPVKGSAKKPGMKGGKWTSTSADNGPIDYSHIFAEMDTDQYVRRGMLMRRLLQDPFYKAMNVTTPARMWMLRHLAHLLEHVSHTYKMDLLQLAQFLGREVMQNFMKFKNAPKEMYPVLEEICPVKPAPSTAIHPGKLPGPFEKNRQ